MQFQFLNSMVGKTIQLERGGPEKVRGELLGIRPDHIVIRTPQFGVLYCALQHVKTISEPIIPEVETPPVSAEEQTEETALIQEAPIVDASNLADLLLQLKHTLVRVNHGGPNSLLGVLIESAPDYVTVIHEMKDFIHFPTYHIRSVSRVYHQDQPENKKNDEKNTDTKNGSQPQSKSPATKKR